MIDTHAHLYEEGLVERVDEVVLNAKQSGVGKIICIGFDKESSIKAVEMTKRFDNVYAVVGCHPHEASGFRDEDLDFYADLCKDEKVLAIGEIGLDYHYDLSPRDVQREVFVKQIRLAHRINKNTVLHIREATKDMLDILEDNKQYLNKVLLHCYSGSVETATELMKYDTYFAYGGAITFKNANKCDVLAVTKDRLMFETDCPYMTPVPYRGTVNEPKYISLVVQKACECLNTTEDELKRIASKNVKEFFGIEE